MTPPVRMRGGGDQDDGPSGIGSNCSTGPAVPGSGRLIRHIRAITGARDAEAHAEKSDGGAAGIDANG